MYNVLLWIHIVAAATWFGGALAIMFLAPKVGTGDGGSKFYTAWVDMGRKIFSPAAVVVLATGIGMVIDAGISFGATFVSIGFLAVIVGAGLGMGYYAPQGRKVVAALDAGEDAGPITAKLRTFGLAELALLAFTIYAMTVMLGA